MRREMRTDDGINRACAHTECATDAFSLADNRIHSTFVGAALGIQRGLGTPEQLGQSIDCGLTSGWTPIDGCRIAHDRLGIGSATWKSALSALRLR
jgi:hypothetical protein